MNPLNPEDSPTLQVPKLASIVNPLNQGDSPTLQVHSKPRICRFFVKNILFSGTDKSVVVYSKSGVGSDMTLHATQPIEVFNTINIQAEDHVTYH